MLPHFVALLVGAAPPTVPICAQPSHDRLIVRPGRDVCGASLNAKGEPRAAGLMPTACPRADDLYAIDARGTADVCTSKGEKG